jgi:hypothetical protein
MVTEEENLPEKKINVQPDDVPKLILPQDRYCKLSKTVEKSEGVGSKFDRYNNSDESESESEEEACKSESEDKSELMRSNSLEALMAELENEIQGGNTKPQEEKPKAKPKKKRKISVNVECDDKLVETKAVFKENLKPEVTEPVKKQSPGSFPRQRKWQGKPRRHAPQAFVAPNLVHRPAPPPPEMLPPVVAFPPPVQPFPPYNPMGFDNGVFVAPPVVFEAPPPQLPPLHIAPPHVYERPLSPLAINTDAYSTTTLAPLSPRSAAFVLENRAIIEKRKRRSYSRSPSPLRFRRSKSPKRLSLSPKRPSKSPKRRSLSPSPVRKVLPPKVNSPKKASSIHGRLGLKSNKTDTEDDKSKKERSKPKEEKKQEGLDPVLEARRKKFERNEITMTEGVIRLRVREEADEPKKEEATAAVEEQIEDEDDDGEEIDEDALLEGDDAIVLDHKIDALFSDEESDSDNEGRFKTKQETNQKVPILPFTKLINGAKSEVKNDLRIDDRRGDRPKSERRKRFRSRSPPKKAATKKNDKVKQTIAFPADARKIEIKIRNPAKYEKAEGQKGGEEKVSRKVEVAKKIEAEEKDAEGTNESTEEASSSNINEGDLRAQLSRKRAERQKHPLPDVVPSRLLQNALQGVGFRKGKKSKSKDDNTDGKLPIHLRLGAANSSEVFGKKSRKHKNKGSQEQVLCFVASFLTIIIFSLLKLLFDAIVRLVGFYSILCCGRSISVH